MARQVAEKPPLPNPSRLNNAHDFSRFATDLVNKLFSYFIELSIRINVAFPRDGSEAMDNPLPLASYTVATLPTASSWTAGLIYVSDETGGAVPAFSDGTNWRRVTDRTVVS